MLQEYRKAVCSYSERSDRRSRRFRRIIPRCLPEVSGPYAPSIWDPPGDHLSCLSSDYLGLGDWGIGQNSVSGSVNFPGGEQNGKGRGVSHRAFGTEQSFPQQRRRALFCYASPRLLHWTTISNGGWLVTGSKFQDLVYPCTTHQSPGEGAPQARRRCCRRRRAGIILLNCRNSETCDEKEKKPLHDHLEYLLAQNPLSEQHKDRT